MTLRTEPRRRDHRPGPASWSCCPPTTRPTRSRSCSTRWPRRRHRLRLTGVRTTCLVVDDNSPDGTGEVSEPGRPAVSASNCGSSPASARGWGTRCCGGWRPPSSWTGPPSSPSTATVSTTRSTSRCCSAPPGPVHADITIGSRWARGGQGARDVGRPGRRGLAGRQLAVPFRDRHPRRQGRHHVVPGLLRRACCASCSTSESKRFAATASSARPSAWPRRPASRSPRCRSCPGHALSGLSKLNRREVWRYFRSLPELREERRRLMAERRDVTDR